MRQLRIKLLKEEKTDGEGTVLMDKKWGTLMHFARMLFSKNHANN